MIEHPLNKPEPKRVYIAGPMTGIPQFNFPAFDDAARDLRAVGHDVVSPAELDDPEDRAAALASPDGQMHGGHHMNKTWGDFLARDVKLIADDGIEAIYVLSGWSRSRGARLETFVGKAMCGIPVFMYDGNAPYGLKGEVPTLVLVQAWAGGLWEEVVEVVKGRLISALRAVGAVA